LKGNSFVNYFLFYYSRLTWRIPFLLIISAVAALFDGIGLALFIPLFQIAQSGTSDVSDLGNLDFILLFFERHQIVLTIEIVLVFMILVFVVKGLVSFVRYYFATKIRERFIRNIREEMVDGLCNLSYQGFVNINFGRIQNVINSEITKVKGALLGYLSTLQAGIMLVGYLCLAFITNFNFALLILLAGTVSGIIFFFIDKKVEASSLEHSYIESDVQGKILESIWSYKYLKATGLILENQKKITRMINKEIKISLKMEKIFALSNSLIEPITVIIVAGVIFFQVEYLQASIFSILLSLIFFYRSLTSFFSLQGSWQAFLESSGGIHTVKDLIQEFDTNVEAARHEEMSPMRNELCLHNVFFAYRNGLVPVLNGISLTINKNETVAFVGESGSGKTTIVNILAGLLLPDKGQVTADGKDLNASSIKSFRQEIAYITQEPVVFNNTLYNNITFGMPKTPENMERFWKVIDDTALAETVEKMTNKEDTMLGDNGMLISGGQKQRVSIARELFRNCSLLFMDEATSSLDSETEEVIQENINRLKGKYTIVIIAHRLSTIRHADRIYLMEKGQISAQGTFESLQNESPKFRNMVELQKFSKG
jgi:subfamily B ATP-binding cassette protein MsbA